MIYRILLACLAAPLLVGCSGGSDLPKLYPVTGKLTKGGAPLGGMSISLVAADDKTKAPALVAVTKDDGSFDIFTMSGHRGAPEGNYKVVVVAPPEQIDYAKVQKGPPKKSAVIPKTYQTPESTVVSLEVKKTSNSLEIKIP